MNFVDLESIGIKKTCPDGHAMVIRQNRETGEDFLGCSKWSHCQHTEPLPESLKLRMAGAKTLPGCE